MEQKQQVIDTLKQANNILVTVRNSPSVDQLAACIALTLVINGLDKHGTAVFSGRVPSTLDFLEPGKTLEQNTDSLRDFIISLDKAKADKLRYKVEDTVVKVFITPYRTSLSASDLQFSQGDFNVDVVVALGVHNQDDLDQAITAHGRILHDATVISINTETGGAEDLGGVNWIDTEASSLSEIIFSFADQLGKTDIVDNQIATALLTGIVAETGRFSNNKTKPQTMEAAARLLAAGANQELVAAQLSKPEKPEEPSLPEVFQLADPGVSTAPVEQPQDEGKGGELDIEHVPSDEPATPSLPAPSDDLIKQFARNDTTLGDTDTDSNASINDPAPRDLFEELGEPTKVTSQNNNDEPIAHESGNFEIPAPTLPDEAPKTSDKLDHDNQNDEQDALDFLKGRKLNDNVHSRLEPVHTAADLMEDTPKIVPDRHKDEAQAPGTGIDEAINTRFAFNPPSMGGTLTANVPEEHEGEGLGGFLNGAKSAPILTHETPGMTKLPEVEALPAPVEDYKPAKKPEEPKQTSKSDQPKLDAAPLIEPVDEESAKQAEPKQSSQPQFATLEDLEKQVHAHEEASQAAADMPLPVPTGVKLPAPQQSSPTASPTGPLSPPPPVPPPMPNL